MIQNIYPCVLEAVPPLPLKQSWFILYFISRSGGSSDKGQDDGVRHNHGQLPTAGRQGQLFPHGDLKPGRYLRGHRLSYRGDWTARPGSIRLVSPPILPHFFPLDGWIVCRECTGKLFLFSLFSSKVTYLRVYLRKKKNKQKKQDIQIYPYIMYCSFAVD